MGNHCEQLGYDHDARIALISMLQLGPEDHEAVKRLQQQVIVPEVKVLCEGFYHFISEHPLAWDYIGDQSRLESLRNTLCGYLKSFGVEFDQPHYFEERLRIGLAHAKIGLATPIYIAAYRLLMQSMLELCRRTLEAGAERDQLEATLIKLFSLDLTLALDSYRLAEVHQLQDKVESLESEESQLRSQAERDLMTGLYNHTTILARLDALIEQPRNEAGAAKGELFVMMADLDHFKQINDEYGHQVGDVVIKGVADRVQSILRDNDLMGRYGGEEFLILLPSGNKKAAMDIAERIRRHIAATPFHHFGKTIKMTISLGVSAVRANDTSRELIRRADQALYEAKGAGRNRVVFQ